MGLAMVVTCAQGFAWTDLDGGDHGGSNWVIAGGATIASNHYNLGAVSIASGATVRVKAWDGVKYGGVAINAQTITIQGTLDASGAGYGGGNGGAGGNGSTTVSASGGSGISGTAGSGNCGGSGGAKGVGGYDSANPNATRQGWAGTVGAMGGYGVSGGQGDITTDESVAMGSGGGGGGGGGAGWNLQGTTSGGSGGGAGNPGGGWIRLISENSITIRGAVIAKGYAGTRGNGAVGQTQLNPGLGGSGGNVASAGSSLGATGVGSVVGQCYSSGGGGNGGGGAGGGVLIKAATVDALGAIIDNRGGGNSLTNGGSLKVFYNDLQGGSFTNTGRTYTKQMQPPEPGTVFEF